MEINKEFPKSWEYRRIGDIAEIVTGTTPSKKNPEYYGVYIPLVKPPELLDEVIFQAQDNLSKEGAKKARILPANSILVSCIGNLGKTGINAKPVAFNQQINAVIFPKEIEPRFGFYYFQSSKVKNQLESLASATTVAIVNKSKFSTITFPIPPHNEQLRIVAKTEELFTQLDAGVAELQKAKAQLKRYRQAVLKAAVEGELTREWREAHKEGFEPASELLERILSERRAIWEEEELAKMRAKGKEPKDNKWKQKYKEPEKLGVDGLPESPDGWIWGNVGQIGKVSGGFTKNRKRNNYSQTLPYLSVANAYANELRLDNVKTIGVQENELKRILLEKGDLLIVEGNGSIEQIGRVVIWDGSISPCVHQNHLIKVRFNPIELGEFVLYWLLSNTGRERIMIVASSTSGLYTLSISKVSALSVPIPPIMEQMRIIEKIERRLSVADEIEHQLDQGLQHAERLRQSILKRAFEGKLVPQDSNDESALVLLERTKE